MFGGNRHISVAIKPVKVDMIHRSSEDGTTGTPGTKRGIKEAVLGFCVVVRNGAKWEGQVAVVTGEGRGISRAFALALATAGACTAAFVRTESGVAKTVEVIQRDGPARLFATDDLNAFLKKQNPMQASDLFSLRV